MSEDSRLTILHGDALDKLCELPDESVQCCVTSPPFYGLRDYGNCECATKRHASAGFLAWDGAHRNGYSGPCPPNDARCIKTPDPYCPTCRGSGKITGVADFQLGLEKTPEEYVAKMVEVFREVRRVLRNDGTLWLNLGSSMAGSWGNYHPDSPPGKHGQRLKETARWNRPAYSSQEFLPPSANLKGRWKPKDMIPIPWMVAMALQADGWYLRQDIIWVKPNPMPESVTDRCTKSHEYIVLLTKSARYFYDAEAIKEASSENEIGWKKSGPRDSYNISERRDGGNPIGNARFLSTRNKRSVWTVATAPYPEAHFATYPPDLIKPCILAGTSAKGCCSECGAPWERIVDKPRAPDELRNRGNGAKMDFHTRQTGSGQKLQGQKLQDWYDANPGKTIGWQPTCKCEDIDLSNIDNSSLTPCTVLDPFAGSGTTGAVALELGRRAILIELNTNYIELINSRCAITPGFAFA